MVIEDKLWAARDADYSLHLFSGIKPTRVMDWWEISEYVNKYGSDHEHRLEIPAGYLPNLKWEDEPQNIDILPPTTIENIKIYPIYKMIGDYYVNEYINSKS